MQILSIAGQIAELCALLIAKVCILKKLSLKSNRQKKPGRPVFYDMLVRIENIIFRGSNPLKFAEYAYAETLKK